MPWVPNEEGRVDDGECEREGVLSHVVHGPYQAGEPKIHVLLPERIVTGGEYRQLYVLPVEPFDGTGWGDPIEELRRHRIPDVHNVICVVPTFAHAPWYADHPYDRHIRQESHLLKLVLPFIDATYPVLSAPADRLLLGFSKSGWGAFSLLLRHPELFGKAAAWDAPLGQASPTKYGMSEVFADQLTLDKYDVWELLKQRAGDLCGQNCLALLGYSSFRGHHQATHHYMLKLGIDHLFEDGPRREHRWDSGWVANSIRSLIALPTRR